MEWWRTVVRESGGCNVGSELDSLQSGLYRWSPFQIEMRLLKAWGRKEWRSSFRDGKQNKRRSSGDERKNTNRRLVDASICSCDPQACLSGVGGVSFRAIGLWMDGRDITNKRAGRDDGKGMPNLYFTVNSLAFGSR